MRKVLDLKTWEIDGPSKIKTERNRTAENTVKIRNF